MTSLTFSAVALGADNDILADTAMDETATTSVTDFDGQPDVPRNVTVKGNGGNVTGDVVVAGLNAGGEAISETIALNGATLVAGNKAFASIDEITLPTWASANTERVRVGLGAKIGIGLKLARNTVLAAYRDGAREATAPVVAVSASALEANTATLNSALNGSDITIDLYETL
ncbi:MAG: hypothetical protein R3D34_06825 [Nitratireductor sp.]